MQKSGWLCCLRDVVFVLACLVTGAMPAAAKGMFFFDTNMPQPFYNNQIEDQFMVSGGTGSLDMTVLQPVSMPTIPPVHMPEDHGFYTYARFMSGNPDYLPDYVVPNLLFWDLDGAGYANVMQLSPAGDGSETGQHELFWVMAGQDDINGFSASTLAVFTLNIDVGMVDVPLRLGQIANMELNLGESFSFNVAPYFDGQGQSLDYEVFTAREWMNGIQNGNGEYLPDWMVFDTGTHVLSGTWPAYASMYTEAYYPTQVFVRATRQDTGYSTVQSFYMIPRPGISQWEVEANFVANEYFSVGLQDYFWSDEGATYGFEFDETMLPPEINFLEGPPEYLDGQLSYAAELHYPVTAHSFFGTFTTTDVAITIFDPVMVVAPTDDIAVVADDFVSVDIPAIFQQPHPDCGLSYDAYQTGTWDPLPGWLAFDPWVPNLAGTVTQADIDSGTWPLELTIEAMDCGGNIATDDFSINVDGGSGEEMPVFVGPVPDQEATVDIQFDLDISSYFTGGNLSFSLLDPGTPAWLTVAKDGTTLSGMPSSGDVGSLTVVVTAQNNVGSVEGGFLLTVSEPVVEEPPGFDMPIPDQEVEVGTLFSFDVSTYALGTDPTFSYATFDPDTGDSLPNPAWLSLSAGGVLSGTPTSGDVGGLEIEVEAVNGQGSAATVFVLTIVAEGEGGEGDEGEGSSSFSVLQEGSKFIVRARLPGDL